VLSNHAISQLNSTSPAIKNKQCPYHYSFYKECINMNQHINPYPVNVENMVSS